MRPVPHMLLLLVTLGVACVGAEEPTSIPYRRVLAPANQPEAWPQTGDPWVPVQQDEAGRLLGLAQEHADRQRVFSAESVRVHASVINALLTGRGEVEVNLNGAAEAFLPWPTGATRVTTASWASDATPALLGDWGGPPTATHGVLVDRTGVLRFELRGRPVNVTDTRAEYLMGLPVATTTHLTLDLPEGTTPRMERGIVSLLDDPTKPGRRLWEIEVAPGGPGRLVLSKSSPAAPTAMIDASQDLWHTIRESGVETRCGFRLNSSAALPGAVRVALPAGANLIRATQDSLPVEWSLSEEAGGGTIARIALQRLSRRDCEVELTLVSSDAAGQITLASPTLMNARWTEGTVSVELEEPVSLIDIAELAYAYPASAPATVDAEPELFFRLSRPEASIGLQVGRRAPAPAVSLTRAVTLGIDHQRDLHQAQSTVTIQFGREPHSSLRRLNVALGASWAVRSIEAKPSSALEGWEDPPRRGLRAVDIRFAPGAFPSAGPGPLLTLTLVRRTLRHSNRTALTDLLAVAPTGVRVESDLLELTAAPAHQLRLRSAPQPQAPVGDPAAGLLFKTGQVPLAQVLAGGEVELVSEPTRRVSRCDVRVTHLDDLWLYQAELTVPAGGADTARVRFEPPLPESAELTIGDRARSQSELRMPPRDDSFPTQSGVVALTMDGQPATVFRISFVSQDQAPLDIPLPSLVGEGEQQGRLTLIGAGAGVAGLRSNGLTPLAPDAGAPVELDQKSFAFDPNRVGAQDLSALLTRQSHGPVQPTLNLVGIETRVLEAGRLVHHFAYHVRPAQEPVALPLPSNAVLLSARDASGRPIEVDQEAGRSRLLLAAADKARTVYLSIEIEGRSWKPGARLPLEGLVDHASGYWTWRFLTPGSHELKGPSLGREPEPASGSHRLLGPVAGVLTSGVFNPFAPETWWPVAASTDDRSRVRLTETPCPPGWRCYEVVRIGPATPNLVVIHHDQLVGGAATLGVLVACLSAWWWPRAPRVLVTAALAAAVLALLLPGTIAVWGAAVWLGLIAGAMLSPLARFGGGLLGRLSSATTLALPATPTSAAVLLLAIVPTASGQPPAAPPLETVIIPVDASGQQAGDKWYLRGEFLNHLNHLADRQRTAAPAGWLLKSVTLQGGLRGLPPAAGGSAEPWTLALELWTSRRDTNIVLPLRQGDAQWGDKANIDGIATPIEWRDSGDACVLVVAEPGPHRVTVPLTPNVTEEESASSLRLTVPRCSLSELRLMAPDSLAGVRAPELTSPLLPTGPEGMLTGDLSGVDELLLRWGEGPQDAASVLRVCDQLQWLKLRRGGASLEVRCVLEGAAPLPKSLVVRVPSAEDGAAASGDPLRVELTPRTAWNPGLTQLAYGAAVDLPRGSGLGRFAAPPLPPEGATLRSRLMAVSSTRELVVTTPAVDGVAAFDPEEFAARWSHGEAAGAQPDRAVVATDTSAAWQVQADMRPVEPSLVDQRLRLVLGRGASTARLTISTNPANWPLGKLDVNVPPSFELIDCRMGANGDRLPVRTTRPQPSRVVVFRPDHRTSGPESVLELYGEITLPSDRATPLPLLRAPVGLTDPLRVELWRLPNTMVEFAAKDSPVLDEAAAPASSDREMLVGSFRLAAQQPAPNLAIRPSSTRFRVSQVTAHQRTEGGVRHSITAKLRVLSGGLRELAVEFPAGAPPLAIATPAGATLTPAPSEGPRRWRVTLPRDLSAGQQTELRLEGQQDSPAGAHPASLATFPDAAENEVMVALNGGPYITDGRWQTEELTPASGQHDAPTGAFAGPGWTLYQAHPRQRPTVSWTRRDKRPPECLVKLTETTAVADPLGRVAVTSRVYLDPNGAAACRLLIDEGTRLTSLDLNGRAPIATRESDRVWRVTLLSNQRPQALTVTTVWEQPATTRPVVPPQLITGQGTPLADSSAVVSLLGAASTKLRVEADSQPISVDEIARLRLRVLAAQAPQARGDRVSAWWLSRLQDTLQEVDSPSGARAIEQSDKSDQRARDRNTFADAREAAAGEFAYMPDGASYGGQAASTEWRRWQTSSAPNTNTAISVDVVRTTGLGTRVALAVLAVAAGVGYHVGCNQPTVIELLRDRRNTAIGLAGLAWWLWLPLGAFGLLLMAAAAVDEARARYQRILARR